MSKERANAVLAILGAVSLALLCLPLPSGGKAIVASSVLFSASLFYIQHGRRVAQLCGAVRSSLAISAAWSLGAIGSSAALAALQPTDFAIAILIVLSLQAPAAALASILAFGRNIPNARTIPLFYRAVVRNRALAFSHSLNSIPLNVFPIVAVCAGASSEAATFRVLSIATYPAFHLYAALRPTILRKLLHSQEGHLVDALGPLSVVLAYPAAALFLIVPFPQALGALFPAATSITVQALLSAFVFAASVLIYYLASMPLIARRNTSTLPAISAVVSIGSVLALLVGAATPASLLLDFYIGSALAHLLGTLLVMRSRPSTKDAPI